MYNTNGKSVPITPIEVIQNKSDYLSYEIIDSINRLIIENWDGVRSVVFEDEILKPYKFLIISDRDIVANIYRNVGWQVSITNIPRNTFCFRKA
jgi:hypothetical protein